MRRHNIFEGQKMIETAAKYKVRVQVGFQNRAGKNLNEAMKFLHDGGIGHYDTWVGPAEYKPYNEKRLHYNWHWFWNTGNQGPHEFDVARWGMNKNEHPVSVYSTGGIYGIDPKQCAQETPNTQSSLFKYADGKIIEFETRGRYTNEEQTWASG